MNETVKKYYNNEILKQACNEFQIKLNQAKLIRGNSNLIFDCGDKILRISHSDIRTKTDIEAEMNWLRFLIDHQLPVVKIIQSKSSGDIVQMGSAQNHFTVVCFEKIIGNKLSKDNWNNKHFERLGKITGVLHNIGNQFEQKNNPIYKDWDRIIEFDAYKNLPQDNRELIQLHHEIVNQINQLPKTQNNYGLIHYDIHHGNYLLTNPNNDLVLFDFEMTCKSWFINDIATVLYYANHFSKKINDEEFESNFMTYFWKGYEQECTIDEFEKDWILKFLLYRDLMIYGFVTKLWKEKELAMSQTKYLDMIQESIKIRRNKQGI